MTDDPAGPVIDPPGSSRAEQPPPYQWIVMRFTVARPADRGRDSRAPDLAPWTTATTSG